MRRPARAQAAHGEGEADTLLFAVPCEFFERGGNTPAPGAHGVADVPERDFAARGLLRPWGRMGAASGIRQLPVAGSQFMSVMVGVHRLRLYGGLPRLSRRQRSAGQPIGRHGAQNSSA